MAAHTVMSVIALRTMIIGPINVLSLLRSKRAQLLMDLGEKRKDNRNIDGIHFIEKQIAVKKVPSNKNTLKHYIAHLSSC